MKKLLGALLGLTLFLTGCGGSQEDEAVKKAADGFLSAQQAGEIDNTEYVTSEAEDDMGSVEQLNAFMDQLGTLGISQESREAFLNAITEVYGKCWQSWEYQSVKVDGDTATVVVQVTGINPDDIESELDEEYGAQLSNDWSNEHMDELTDYAQSHTQDETIAWMLDRVFAQAGPAIKEKAEEFEVGKTDYRLTLEKKDDKWLVDKIEQRVES